MALIIARFTGDFIIFFSGQKCIYIPVLASSLDVSRDI